jgi:hypothetical protein
MAVASKFDWPRALGPGDRRIAASGIVIAQIRKFLL